MTAMTATQHAPPSAATVLREFETRLVVTAVSDAAEGVKTITLASPDGTVLPAWSPGAHIDLVLGDDLTRQYSLCGDTSDDTSWRIGVLAASDSRGGSVRVHELTTGDTVKVRGPRNHFPLVGAASYQFVAGGIGITPILTMTPRPRRRAPHGTCCTAGGSARRWPSSTSSSATGRTG
jgi:ferredoxin-NADP reductase